MSTGTIREPASFGKRASTHTITVTRNGESRHFNISPAVFSIGACFALMFMIGYFGATAYLVFRDDLIGASYAKHARMKHEYEDRIAALRSKLDHITSRQLLDQQAIETRVQELMKRQAVIGARSGALGKLMEKAEARGITAKEGEGAVPVPSVSPSKPEDKIDGLKTGSLQIEPSSGNSLLASAFSLRGSQYSKNIEAEVHDAGAAFTNQLFGKVASSIDIIEKNQKQHVDHMRIAANKRSDRLSKVLKNLGVPVASKSNSAVGGPFEPLHESTSFDIYINALEESLIHYDALSNKARSLPLAYPVKKPNISSRYGSRIDPFNGRTAMHSGVDFKAPSGTAVLSTGDGKVIHASRKGGFGKLVEIQHKGGLVTRYAHLSRIKVKVGQKVKKGQMVGKVGSTGRSTGPHLHYEIRSGKKAHNPTRFMKAGRKVRDLI